jgi:hypothetical protein
MSALVLGGGMRMGQVIGCTDSRGGNPKEKPYSVQRVLSTLYHRLASIRRSRSSASPAAPCTYWRIASRSRN